MHFTNSTLRFKVPPYSNISCARCNEKLLEGDHKLHFELNSEIGKGLQRVTQSISFRDGTLFDLYTEGTFAKERVFRRGNLPGRCLGKSSNQHYELTQSQNGSFNFGARRRWSACRCKLILRVCTRCRNVAVQSHCRTSN